MPFIPTRIVSGGQTGVDRAALDAALESGIPCGGFVPKGRLAEDGAVPERYPVTECESPDYSVRTELNVLHSDATVILHLGPLAGGTALTLRLCRRHGKPHAAADLADPRALERLRAFLDRERPQVLNVAGPRESSAPGIYRRSAELLRDLLKPRA